MISSWLFESIAVIYLLTDTRRLGEVEELTLRDLAGINLEGADLRAMDLSGASLPAADCGRPVFEGPVSTEPIFKMLRCTGQKPGSGSPSGKFWGAVLRQANHGGAYLDAAVMPPPARRHPPAKSLVIINTTLRHRGTTTARKSARA